MLEAVLDKIGYDPAPGEKQTTAILRDHLIRHTAFMGSKTAVKFVRAQFDALTAGRTIHPDIVKSVLQIAALTGGRKVFNWLTRRLQGSQVEHERMNLLTALGAFKSRELIGKAQQYVLEQVPARNKFVPVLSMAANPYAVPLLWTWYVTNIDQIGRFHPMLYERVIPAGMTSLGFAFSWTADIRVFFMPFFAQSLSLWSRIKRTRRGFMLISVLAIIVTAAASCWMILTLAYRHGGVNLSLWLFRGCPTVPFYYITSRIAAPARPEIARMLFLCGGAAFMAILMVGQLRFPWWPLHPIGFAIGPTQPVIDLWFSIFLGWLLKVLILRLGGVPVLRRLTPFLLGCALGQFIACGAWAIVDGMTGMYGNPLYIYCSTRRQERKRIFPSPVAALEQL